MQAKPVTKIAAGLGAVALVTAVLFASPGRSAEQQKPGVAPNAPDGYVVLSREELHQLVHDEVARQLQDFFAQVRLEQQQREAAGRLQSIPTMAATLRAQIALYKLQHNDQVPTVDQIGDGFRFLMLRTDAAGNRSEDPNAVGPYLQHPVANPMTGKSKVAALGKATAEAGWSYDPQTGMVKAVLPKQFESQLKDRLSPRDVEFAASN